MGNEERHFACDDLCSARIGIDATSEGVHARNVQRLFFEDVLELKAGLRPDQTEQICQFVRQRIGSEYSTREAVRAAVGGSKQWTRKQFCSRLVALAYGSAGIKPVDNSPEWFSAMEQWGPVKAAVTRFVVKDAGHDDVCSVCGDEPAANLEKVLRAARGPDTLTLCDDCVKIRKNMGEPFEAI